MIVTDFMGLKKNYGVVFYIGVLIKIFVDFGWLPWSVNFFYSNPLLSSRGATEGDNRRTRAVEGSLLCAASPHLAAPQRQIHGGGEFSGCFSYEACRRVTFQSCDLM